jgi:hypothetical protein
MRSGKSSSASLSSKRRAQKFGLYKADLGTSRCGTCSPTEVYAFNLQRRVEVRTYAVRIA